MAESRHPLDVEHEPVLVSETLSFLAPQRGGVFVDCTLGPGGHAERLLGSVARIEVVGIDRDPVAIENARRRLQPFGRRFRTVQGDFGDLDELLEGLGLGAVDGILADLGVSSMQLDRPERGFSFRHDGPLDMRMGDTGVTARDIVNGYPEEKLHSIFKDFGEERRARRIARAIVAKRESAAISTTRELREIVARAQPAPPGGRRSRIDPATRVFQALRIEVNQELTQLKRLLEQGIRRLDTDGRIVILSYHSLEDRIVKNVFRDAERGDQDPVTGRSLAESKVLEVLTRKPVRPGEAEVGLNPRSRSARLRAARRL